MLNTKPIPDDEPGDDNNRNVYVAVTSDGEIHLMVPLKKVLMVLNAEQALDLGQALLICGHFSQGMKDAPDPFPFN